MLNYCDTDKNNIETNFTFGQVNLEGIHFQNE
jgi:hypothetical protein